MSADSDGPIAVVQRTKEALFISNVMESTMKRKELAFKTGVSQVCLASMRLHRLHTLPPRHSLT